MAKNKTNDTWKTMAALLPKQPSGDLVQDVMSDIYDNELLAPHLLLFQREAVVIQEEIQQTMHPEDWERRERTVQHRWGALCTCTQCEETFIAGYTSKGSSRGVILAEGQDGQTYTGYAEPGEDAMEVFDGETLQCPYCWSGVELVHKSELRKGRTYQVLQAEVVNVEQYTVLMYWLVQQHIDSTGHDTVQFLPHAALLIDVDGKLRRFRARRTGREVRKVEWLPCAYTRDPMQMPYYSWEAENNRKIGGWTFVYGPELDGHTGEKTGLEQYIRANGCWPGAYLHVWQRFPQVENLMRQGFAQAVVDAIDDPLDNATSWRDLNDAPPITWVDWREVKPHRMLGMDKAAFREIAKQGWSGCDLEVWSRYRLQIPGADAGAFAACRRKVGSAAVGQLLEMMAAGWEDLTPARVVRYLERQEMLADGVQHLIDYRKMLRYAEMAETQETLWPRNLMEAHERLAEFWAARGKVSCRMSFTSTALLYQDLVWTDGELCIVIPQAEEDLVTEGKVLRHCVGTYGYMHCTGRPVFFVRKYRRPERSYYTLQIDMRGKLPKELQLHGYGNEHHGEHKQHTHTIPQKVRDFCDRWEREVLTPWCAARHSESEQKLTAAGKKGREARPA